MLNPSIQHRRWVTGVLVAAIALATVAPAAQADRKRYKRYKYDRPAHSTRVVTRYHSPGSVYVVRRSDHGRVIAGFLGGLFLGATLARSAPAGYSYYDPYCGERFVSLEFYRSHFHRHHHPRIVRVIEVDSGDCVGTYQYRNGGWHDRDHGDRDDQYDEDWDDN